MALAAGSRLGPYEVLGSLGDVHRYAYEPSPDGSPSLVSIPSGRGSPPITVVLKWRRK